MKIKLSILGGLIIGLALSLGSVADAAFAPISIPAGGTATTTAPSGQLLYGGSTAYQSTATSTLTASSPLSLDQPVVKVGGTNSVLTISTSGTWSGNAGTATALAANGTNCTAGNYPLGVDASGNAENCTADAAGGGGSGTVGTSTNETSGFLPYWTTTSATPALLGKIGTTTLGFSGPFTGYASIGTLVGGSNTTLTWTGLATTSQPSSSNLLVSNGGAGVYGVATSTLTASSPLTGSFTQVGSGGSLGCTNASSGVTGCLTGTDWNTFNGKLGSYDAWTHTGVWGISPLSATSTTLSLTGNTFALIASSTLEVSSSTGPQLFINDAGTSNPWFLRAVNGNFYLGTSTVANATSSVAAISIVQGATGANATTTSSFMDWVFKHTSQTAFSIMDAFGSTVLKVNTASTTGPIFAVQATTTDHAILFSVDQYGHLTASSTPGLPTVSSCGTGSPSVTAGSSDSVGSVTTGTGSPTACTITFNKAFTSAPVVLLEDTSNAVTVDISAISTTAFTISMSAGLTSTKIYWFAIQGASTL